MKRVIVGCGYLGQRVARRLIARGEEVLGIVRGRESAGQLSEQGIPAQRMDLDQPPLDIGELKDAELFYFAPPSKTGDCDTRVRNLISAMDRSGYPRRMVYLSTTGVYGDCQGAWVDELRPPRPLVARARRRLDAENSLRQGCARQACQLVILRVAGIYGPGRLPLQRLREGHPIVREEEAPYSNRIHVDDLVQACLAAMKRGGDNEIYNLADGHPTTMTDYFNRVADLTGLARPEQIPMEAADDRLSSGMRSYMAESRRLDNAKMLRELEIQLRYPSLDSGLPACVRGAENEA